MEGTDHFYRCRAEYDDHSVVDCRAAAGIPAYSGIPIYVRCWAPVWLNDSNGLREESFTELLAVLANILGGGLHTAARMLTAMMMQDWHNQSQSCSANTTN